MNRRTFLAAASGVLAQSWTLPDRDLAVWSAARAAAERYGLAIAVLIRPEPGGPRERAWSSLHEASTPDDLLPLVAALPICVSPQVALTVSPSEEIPADAWAVIVDGVGKSGSRLQVIQATLDPRPNDAALEGLGDSTRRRMLRDPIVPLLRALTCALEPDPSTVVLRGLANQQKLPADRVARLLQFFCAGRLDGQRVPLHAVGPMIRIWMDRAPVEHAEALSEQVRSDVESRWRQALGFTLPAPPPLQDAMGHCGLCGIGYVDSSARHFLDRFTKVA